MTDHSHFHLPLHGGLIIASTCVVPCIFEADVGNVDGVLGRLDAVAFVLQNFTGIEEHDKSFRILPLHVGPVAI